MTPVEQRIADLLERWLESLERHRDLAKLDDQAYWRARKWVEHERPAAWVIEVARTKTRALRKLFEARRDVSPEQFAEALDLIAFLANLVGSQNVQRFIPLIEGDTSGKGAQVPSRSTPDTSDTQRQPIPGAAAGPTAPGSADTGTREMPRPATAVAAPQQPVRPRPSHAHARVANRSAPRGTEKKPPRKTEVRLAPPTPLEAGVIADAVRLLKWGRAWYELSEAIARMADRPAIDDVRRILRDRRTEIESRAAAADTG